MAGLHKHSDLVLGVCLSLGLLVRLLGAGHGCPDFVIGDERAVNKVGERESKIRIIEVL